MPSISQNNTIQLISIFYHNLSSIISVRKSTGLPKIYLITSSSFLFAKNVKKKISRFNFFKTSKKSV
jgi:hypothetical protein